MSSARSAIRALIGNGLARGYYVSSTLTALSTTRQLIDSKRVEEREFWNGASLKISSQEVRVSGGSGEGRLYLDGTLTGAPASATAYEMVKGWTIADMDRGIDEALRWGYPWIYLPVNDRATNSETTGTTEITLTATWKEIKYVRREIVGSSPQRWIILVEGRDYTIRVGTSGALVFEMLYDPVTGTDLHFIGESIMTLAAADASTCAADDQVIIEGALWWLYKKGIQPDEPSLSASFDQKASEHQTLFTAARAQSAMPRETRPVQTPHLVFRNDGRSVREWD